MDVDSAHLDAEKLLADREWLSRLAHRLVRDPALADDAVQDAWLTAKRRLESRGDRRLPDRGLLGSTLRGVLMHARRAAARRRYHEQAAASAEALPSAEELLEIGERQQTLWRHLSRLEDPYRRTLLLRFQQSLSTRELAARLGVAEDTVRWRTRRGLALLRDALEREEGSAGLLGLVPVAVLALRPSEGAVLGWSATFGGSLIMKKSLLALMSAILVLGITWLSLDRVPGTAGSPAVGEANEPPRSDRGPEFAEARSIPSPEPERRPAGVRPDVALDRGGLGGVTGSRAAESLVAGRVIDLDGQPVGDAHVTLSVPGRWAFEGRSSADGSFAVACPSAPHANAVLEVAPGRFHALAQLRLGYGADSQMPPISVEQVDVGDVVVQPAGVVRGRVVDGDGAPVAAAEVWARARHIHVQTDEGGQFEFGGLPLGSSYLRVSADGFARAGAAVRLERATATECGDIVVRPLDRIRVVGNVLDEAGAPVAGALVSSQRESMEVPPSGAFQLDFAGEGRVFLTASAEGFRETETKLCLDGASVDFALVRAGALHRFRVLDRDDGTALAGASVSLTLRPDSPLRGLVDSGARLAVAPGTEQNEAGPDGRLDAHGSAIHDDVVVRAPGYRSRRVELGAAAGPVQDVLLQRKERAWISGVIPADVHGAGGRVVEVQILERLSGTPGSSTAPAAWASPPASIDSTAELSRWLGDDPVWRVKSRHLLHADDEGAFGYPHGGRAVARAVTRFGRGQVALTAPLLLRPGRSAEVAHWRTVALGSLEGHVDLPRGDLSAAVRLGLVGADQAVTAPDERGDFEIGELVPGSYLLAPTAVPDGVDRASIERVVRIAPGRSTRLALDLGLPPYGAVELSLLVNGARPPVGFGVTFMGNDAEFTEVFKYGSGRPIRLLVPAANGYRVAVEPLDGSGENARCVLDGTVDVPAGASRLDVAIETCTVVCSLGAAHHASLPGTWQFLSTDGPDGLRRDDIEAARHIAFETRTGAARDSVDVTFRCVPVSARNLRFRLERIADGEAGLELPFEAKLAPGETVRVVFD